MLVGILSDTHDRADMAAAAVNLLRGRGAEHLIHCGDLCNAAVLDALAGGPASFVWGNNDEERGALKEHADWLGVACLGVAGDLTLGGKRFAVTHGDRDATVRAFLDSQEYDYLLVGHSHMRYDGRDGRTRVVNPGALFRSREKTVALLDAATDALEFLTVSPPTG